MKKDIGIWVLGLFLFGSILVSFGMYKDYQNSKKVTHPKTSVEGAATEKNTVSSVIDGDTLILQGKDKIRLIGINAPEEGEPNYKAAQEKLESLVLGKSVEVAYDVQKSDQFGRTLAYIYVGDTFVNLEMVRSGLAVVETIQPDSLHSDVLSKGEVDARKNCAGMWEGLCHPDASACVQLGSIHQSSSSANLNDEWVELKNTCESNQNLVGYLIKDTSAGNSYTFKNVEIPSKKTIKVHSGCSMDSSLDLYWQCPARSVPVWNNTGDSAFLYDGTGKLVSEMSY